MRRLLLVVVVAAVVCSFSLANADAISDKILDLKEKIVELQNKGELGFRNFTLCSNIITFASYVPLKEPKIKRGGDLVVYYEPANFYTSKVDGRYDIWMTQDMVVLSEGGDVLLDKKDALTHRYNTSSPVLDLYCQNTVKLGELPVGKYTFKAVLHDKLREKNAEKSIVFEVVE